MINGINHITLAVKDVEKSFEFYKDILSLKPVQNGKMGRILPQAIPGLLLIKIQKYQKLRDLIILILHSLAPALILKL
jgi:catechol 2,3-dioxygenase-like lactoylglutathione lyase family enzyme